jgi:hypothetical protein
LFSGRLTAHDIAGFARMAIQNNVRAMGPEEMATVTRDKSASWFIDFFTPVCFLVFFKFIITLFMFYFCG